MIAKPYRVTVTTRDGRRTHWIETSTARNGAARICDRVTARLAGLNLDRVEVDPVTPPA
jgi:hypothetical protein